MEPDWFWGWQLAGILSTSLLGGLTLFVIWRQVVLTRRLHHIEARRDFADLVVETLNAFEGRRFALRILNRGGHASAIAGLRIEWYNEAGMMLDAAHARELVPDWEGGIDGMQTWQRSVLHAVHPAEGRLIRPGERATVPFECDERDLFQPEEWVAGLQLELEPVVGAPTVKWLLPGKVHHGRSGVHRHYSP